MNEIIFKIQTGEENEEVVICFNSEMNGLIGKPKVTTQRNIVRDLLHTIYESKDVSIYYDESGAPFLNNSNQYISLSHSQSWFAVQRANVDRVGVDIQVLKQDIAKGMYYFVNKREEEKVEMSVINLNLIWAVKEAVYKYKRGKLDRYKEVMTVVLITESIIDVEVEGEIVRCAYTLKEDFALVYVV